MLKDVVFLTGVDSSGTHLLNKTDKTDNTEMKTTTNGNLFIRFVTDGTTDSVQDKGFTLYYISGTSTGNALAIRTN